ncbi:hypothetical protein K9N68_37485 (plasmid) [Kovacikia minuta CCNUW1]|uniref:hypothetical protein n=1 Tax=Kovacikia minuta TaxID=2931930 RepID=UPI001CCE3280|nr:hypothetical protein [Kovacikia minuta]UBF29907.1 hypothetical protein K9N68_37485 [Kovacikia minuta CCNUW1]
MDQIFILLQVNPQLLVSGKSENSTKMEDKKVKKIIGILLAVIGYFNLLLVLPQSVYAQTISEETEVSGKGALVDPFLHPVSVFKCRTTAAPTTVFVQLILNLQSLHRIDEVSSPRIMRQVKVWGRKKLKDVGLGKGPHVRLYRVGEDFLTRHPLKTSGVSTYNDFSIFRFPRGTGNRTGAVQASAWLVTGSKSGSGVFLHERFTGKDPIQVPCIGFPKDEREQQDQKDPWWHKFKGAPFFIGDKPKCKGGSDCIDYCGDGVCNDWAHCSSRSVALVDDGAVLDEGWTMSYVG